MSAALFFGLFGEFLTAMSQDYGQTMSTARADLSFAIYLHRELMS